MKKVKKPDWISQQDWDDLDIPEQTAEDFARARPAREVDPELVAAYEQGRIRYPGQRGRQKEPTKVAVNIRLSPDVVAFFKSKGKNWQTRIDEALQAFVNVAR
jgi:uncharacterized protein (DUF4415 family)